VIGLFNIIGSLGQAGSAIHAQALHPLDHLFRSCARDLRLHHAAGHAGVGGVFGAAMGLLWLSTVAPTNGIIALMFGTRWLATLAGMAFFSHQVGGFLGVWLGGLVFVRTQSYDAVWWLSILFGVLSAVINLPIVEKPVVRAAAVPAAA
jgi:hypothetical protein